MGVEMDAGVGIGVEARTGEGEGEGVGVIMSCARAGIEGAEVAREISAGEEDARWDSFGAEWDSGVPVIEHCKTFVIETEFGRGG